jgi:hypothetical protein
VLALNQAVLPRLGGVKQLVIVPGASHLFEEPGTLDAAARLTADWLCRQVGGAPRLPRV